MQAAAKKAKRKTKSANATAALKASNKSTHTPPYRAKKKTHY